MSRIDIEQPRYDQTTYVGRVKHFYLITSPLNLFASDTELDRVKRIVDDYRQGKLTGCMDQDELWRSKYLYDSAFHPETGEKTPLIGRMSAQVPMNTAVIVALLVSYKSTPATVFFQWFSQSFNALVNWTNRSGGNANSRQLAVAYVCATGGALTSSLGFKALSRHFPPVLARMVPYTAVAVANAINIPMMRAHELREGISVFDEQDHELGKSKATARRAIAQVTLSRTLMAGPSMILGPILLNMIEKCWAVTRRPLINVPLHAALCGILMAFATPMSCALFPQRSSTPVGRLEPELRRKLYKQGFCNINRLLYNKGL